MIGAYLRRGVAVGMLAGILAGLLGLAVGEPSLDEAVRLEAATAAAAGDEPAAADDSDVAITRGQQKAGLVAGSALLGLAAGAVFGLVSAWAVGRVAGDGWTRSLKLGATVALALVVLPALKYPPNPPGVGDPATVGTRTTLYLGLILLGVLLAAAAWTGARALASGPLSRPARQALVGVAVVAAAALLLAGLPTVADPVAVPAELLWRFRLGALATQTALWTFTAAAFGLLTARAEQHAPVAAAR